MLSHSVYKIYFKLLDYTQHFSSFFVLKSSGTLILLQHDSIPKVFMS